MTVGLRRLEAGLLGYQKADERTQQTLTRGGAVALAVRAAGDEHPLGHERLLALGEVLGRQRQGVQPRVAE